MTYADQAGRQVLRRSASGTHSQTGTTHHWLSEPERDDDWGGRRPTSGLRTLALQLTLDGKTRSSDTKAFLGNDSTFSYCI